MWPSVASAFVDYSTPLEGNAAFMYLDVKGFVTTAIGVKCDPLSDALWMPWQVGGRAATQAEISASWNAVKGAQDRRRMGGFGGHFDALGGNVVRLTPDGVLAVVERVLSGFEATLKQEFPEWDSWPADAQLGTLSLAWAMGPNLSQSYPRFTAAARAQDWLTCAKESHLSTEGNPGVAPRNTEQEICFDNAAYVKDQGLDPSELVWTPAEKKNPGSTPSANRSSGIVTGIVVVLAAGALYKWAHG